MSKRSRLALQAAIRAAMEATGKSVNALAKESGISQAVLQRFVSGKRGLTLETAEKLCAFLGLELKPLNEKPLGLREQPQG